MKRLKITILAIILTSVVVLCFGCSRRIIDQSAKSTEVSNNKASSTKEVNDKLVKETTQPATNMSINAGNPCDSNGNLKVVYIELKSGNNTSILDTRSGSLKTDCHCDSTVNRLEREIKSRDSLYAASSKKVQKKTEYKQVVENVIPRWCWITMVCLLLYSILISYAFFQTLITKFR